jgi:hypothetical protein
VVKKKRKEKEREKKEKEKRWDKGLKRGDGPQKTFFREDFPFRFFFYSSRTKE